MNIKSKIILIPSFVILSACGGSDNSNEHNSEVEKVKFTSENYVIVAREAVITSPTKNYHGFSISEATGMQAIAMLGVGEIRNIVERTVGAPTRPFPRNITNEKCNLLGGEIIYQDHDNNNNFKIDAGDIIKIYYKNCNAMLNGALTVKIDKASKKDPLWAYTNNITATINFENLSIKSSENINTLGNGDMTFEMDYLSYRTINTGIKSSNFTFQTNTSENKINRLLKDYQASINIRDPFFNSSTNGTIISSLFDNKSFEFRTLTSINTSGGEGSMILNGANQAAIHIKTFGTLSAVIELDEDGDGEFEFTQTVPWDRFIDL